MGDLISRQAVNKLVDELARAISDEKCHIQRGRNYGRIMHDILELPSVEPDRGTGKWIPIRIKSPQNGQRIFISTIKGTIHDEIWNMNCIHNYATDGCWYRNWFVVAWMPFFIEPYKAKSDDRDEI